MSLCLGTLEVGMDRITISVPPEPDFHLVLRLVVGGIGARSRLSYEQVSELQLAVESLVAQRHAESGAIVIEADVDDGAVSLLVGPFEVRAEPAVMRVVERLVNRATVVERSDGDWVELASEVVAA